LLHHLGGLLPCLPQRLEQHRESHETGVVLLRACDGLPSSICPPIAFPAGGLG
jgi:hypothetical protein